MEQKHRGMAAWFQAEEEAELSFMMLANHSFRIIFIVEAVLKIGAGMVNTIRQGASPVLVLLGVYLGEPAVVCASGVVM